MKKLLIFGGTIVTLISFFIFSYSSYIQDSNDIEVIPDSRGNQNIATNTPILPTTDIPTNVPSTTTQPLTNCPGGPLNEEYEFWLPTQETVYRDVGSQFSITIPEGMLYRKRSQLSSDNTLELWTNEGWEEMKDAFRNHCTPEGYLPYTITTLTKEDLLQPHYRVETNTKIRDVEKNGALVAVYRKENPYDSFDEVAIIHGRDSALYLYSPWSGDSKVFDAIIQNLILTTD